MKNSALPNNRRVKSLLPVQGGDPVLLYRWSRGVLVAGAKWSSTPKQEGNR